MCQSIVFDTDLRLEQRVTTPRRISSHSVNMSDSLERFLGAGRTSSTVSRGNQKNTLL